MSGKGAGFGPFDQETTRQLRELFAQEANEHLDRMSASAMCLSGEPGELQEILRAAHTLKGSAATVGLTAVERAAHALEERCVALAKAPGADPEVVVEPLLAAFDVMRALAGEDPDRAAVVALSAEFERCLEQVEALAAAADGAGDAAAERRDRGDRRFVGDRRFDDPRLIRVDVGRVDELMNAVGQLVIDRTRIERRVEDLKGLARDLSVCRQGLHTSVINLGTDQSDEAVTRVGEVDVEIADAVANLERATVSLMEDSEALRRTTRTLEEQLMRVRMMPIELLFARLQRPVYEMARSEGKQFELLTEGESAEMDRSVVERITDPLIHLIRNAIAHGIESPQARRRAGKPEMGTIRLTARHHGDMVFLEVEDDGAGIDEVAVREVARKAGLLADDAEGPAAGDLLDIIFSSGFSTRPQVDGLAGRGIGLDVVRRNITGLGGDIRVASRRGEGTRFTISLPMTTAIARALLFKEGDQVYALPVTHVIGTTTCAPSMVQEGNDGVRRLLASDGPLPLLYLHEVLGCPPAVALGGDRIPAIIAAFGNTRFAVTCSKVIGPREIVLKRLGPLLGAIPLFAGATISGSGKVQFVLDVAALAEMVQRGWRGRALPVAEPHPRVLLADDSRSVREAVALILRSAGYTVDLAADGWEAWERLRCGAYDMLVTDLEMPRVHGYDLIGRCRRHPTLAQLPILVLTSRTADRNRRAALEAGADRFISKPINRRVILQNVTGLLDPADSN